MNRRLPKPYGEPLSDARTPLADFFSILLDPDGHADWMDGFLNPVRPCRIYLLRIDIRPEQPIPQGKQNPEIRPRLSNLFQMMHPVIAWRDEEPLQFPRLPGHVHMHPVIGQDHQIGIKRKEEGWHWFEQWERQQIGNIRKNDLWQTRPDTSQPIQFRRGMMPAMDRPDPRRVPEPMHPVGQPVDDEQEDHELKGEWQRLPIPVKMAWKGNMLRHLGGYDEEDLVGHEGCHILQEHLPVPEWTRRPPILHCEKEQADSPINGQPLKRNVFGQPVEHDYHLRSMA